MPVCPYDGTELVDTNSIAPETPPLACTTCPRRWWRAEATVTARPFYVPERASAEWPPVVIDAITAERRQRGNTTKR